MERNKDMDKELNKDARTKQDLLYEYSSLNSRLSNEIVKNEHLEQQCKKQKEVIDRAISFIVKETKSMPMNGCKIRLIELLDILKEVE